VPPDRVAGTVFITNGRVHDVPAEAAQLGFTAPVQNLGRSSGVQPEVRHEKWGQIWTAPLE
jgi:hypothetical protein